MGNVIYLKTGYDSTSAGHQSYSPPTPFHLGNETRIVSFIPPPVVRMFIQHMDVMGWDGVV